MKQLALFFTALCLTILALLLSSCASRSNASLTSLSFPDVPLEHDEYIQSVELSITNGRVMSINHFIDDWSARVTWDRPGVEFVSLEAGHFNSGLASAHELDGMLIIAPVTAYFDISAILHTESTTPTGRSDRTIRLDHSHLLLKPVPPAGRH